MLVFSLFEGDTQKILEILDGKKMEKNVNFMFFSEISLEELNRKDFQENTPVFLAIKLLRKNGKMLEIVKKMFLKGADPNVADKNNWSPLDEAVNQVFKGGNF